MTFKQLKKEITSNPDFKKHNNKGQFVFNYIEQNYKVGKIIINEELIDCYYNDNLIDDFIYKAVEWINKLK
jgi:hypothetical protein